MSTAQPLDASRRSAKLEDVARIRTLHLKLAKERGEKFSMLTTYDAATAALFDQAGVDVLLIGDSLGNTVLGFESTLPVTVDHLIPVAAAVSGAAKRALVVVDLPFGSYEESPQQAVRTAVRFMKESGVHAVKIEAGVELADHVAAVVRAGIPVMGHVGFTPQAEHALGGYRIQGRGEAGAAALLADAQAMQDAGCFSVLLEMVTGSSAQAVDEALSVPTVGIGAGNATTGQVLVWQDMLGLHTGRMPRFVKQYAQLSEVMTGAVKSYVSEVRDGQFPGPEHTFSD